MNNNTTKPYYNFDIDIEKILLEGGMLDDLFYLKDLERRKLFFSSNVCQVTVEEIIKHILQFNAEDKGIDPRERKPILLYISSYGGEIDAGFQLIDVIMTSKTPVYTINLGVQYSMGFLIGLAGHMRYALPTAKYLCHDGSSFVYTSGTKAQDEMEFQRRVDERIKDFIVTRTNITAEEYDSKLRVEWYLFAEEAKEKGVTDMIVGVDCDIDEII